MTQDVQAETDALAARVGNLAARTAIALAKHKAVRGHSLAQDLLAPLAAERAIVCAQLRSTETGQTIGQLPPALGCLNQSAAHHLALVVGNGEANLDVWFSDLEIAERAMQRGYLLLLGMMSAFGIAVLTASIGFQFIISRPLRKLLTAIRENSKTGAHRQVKDPGNDELGEVVRAFNEMLAVDSERESQLAAARDAADATSRTKSRFLANMGHELRTPLNAIIGFSGLIRSESFGAVGNTNYADAAKHIHAAGSHLLELVNDILDLSKIEAGATEMNEEQVDLLEIAEFALSLIAHRAENGQVDTKLELSDTLAPLHADGRRLKQILLNLVSNAVKFTEPGGKVTIKMFSHLGQDCVLTVTDTGIGISPDDIQKALEPFQQLESSRAKKYEGTGLGLPLTKALVELHGGTMALQSEVGAGTTVTVRFPAERVIAAKDASTSGKAA